MSKMRGRSRSRDEVLPKLRRLSEYSFSAFPTTVRGRAPERPDILGILSAGVILMIIGLTYVRRPIDPSVVINYFESMGEKGTFIKPPLVLFEAAIFFLYAVGAWGIVLSGLRIVFERSARKALGDLIGAFFSFFLAFLLSNYAADIFTGRMTLAYFVIAIGLLVIVNALVRLALPEK